MAKSYEQYKPTKNQVLFPIIIFLITAIIGGICLFCVKQLTIEESRTSFRVPTSKEIAIEEEGLYTVYLSLDTIFEGKQYIVPNGYQGLEVKAYCNEKEVTVDKVQDIYKYEDNQDTYINFYTFKVSEPGMYRFECDLTNDSVKEAIVSIGKTQENMGKIIVLRLVGCMLLIMGAIQFVGYLLYNGVNYGVYLYKKNNAM